MRAIRVATPSLTERRLVVFDEVETVRRRYVAWVPEVAGETAEQTARRALPEFCEGNAPSVASRMYYGQRNPSGIYETIAVSEGAAVTVSIRRELREVRSPGECPDHLPRLSCLEDIVEAMTWPGASLSGVSLNPPDDGRDEDLEATIERANQMRHRWRRTGAQDWPAWLNSRSAWWGGRVPWAGFWGWATPSLHLTDKSVTLGPTDTLEFTCPPSNRFAVRRPHPAAPGYRRTVFDLRNDYPGMSTFKKRLARIAAGWSPSRRRRANA